jgi:hypothetical protein
MVDDDRRVEPKSMLVGRGLGTTPERIEELRRQAEEIAKARRPKPVVPFDRVLAEGAQGAQKAEPSAKERRRRALAKKGPKPALLHPSQRKTYGRSDNSDEPVVIKG